MPDGLFETVTQGNVMDAFGCFVDFHFARNPCKLACTRTGNDKAVVALCKTGWLNLQSRSSRTIGDLYSRLRSTVIKLARNGVFSPEF
jgi:hypothetical protein